MYLKWGIWISRVSWAKCVLPYLEFPTSLKMLSKRSKPPSHFADWELCWERGRDLFTPPRAGSVLAPPGPEGAHFPDDHTNNTWIFTQSSYTVKKVCQDSSFYFGSHYMAIGNFILLSPATFLRFRKKPKSLFTAGINKVSVKPLGEGGDNNCIPNLGQLQKGLVKLPYYHYISLMSWMTSKNS